MNIDEWLAWQERLHPRSIELGLERLRVVANRLGLGAPARHCVTVAGTNGKGSTVAFIEAMARASGWRVGAYTSPHLLRYNERVRIGGETVSNADLIRAFEHIEQARGEVALTYFEFGTLAALWLFAEAKLDLAVLEVGLGGRLDAVNYVDADVAVVVSVGIDHTDWLGPDRETIAREKAGIFRSGRPAIIAEREPPAALLAEAARIGARAIRAGIDYDFAPLNERQWRWSDGQTHWNLPFPRLAALVQIANAAAAIAALRALPALPLSGPAVAQGVAHAVLPARLQRFAGAVEIIVDVAHNAAAAEELARWLSKQPKTGRTHAVFSALGDKDISAIVGALGNEITDWWLAGLADRSARGLTVEQLRARVMEGREDIACAGCFIMPEAALDAARRAAQEGDRVVVFGSFLTAAAALAVLQAMS